MNDLELADKRGDIWQTEAELLRLELADAKKNAIYWRDNSTALNDRLKVAEDTLRRLGDVLEEVKMGDFVPGHGLRLYDRLAEIMWGDPE